MTAPEAEFAVLTPEGRGAIAVVKVWGRDALAVVDAAFRPEREPGRPLSRTRPGKPRLGRVGSEGGEGDEVVAIRLPGTPAEVELQGHGGFAAVATVVEALAGVGARRVDVQTFLNRQSRSALQAEAVADLVLAPTLRAAEILLEQAAGALDAELTRLAGLIDAHSANALAAFDALIARGRLGVRLIEGWKVVLAGRPNVGKSALLNALAGYERAIVSPTAGTTRDVLSVRTAFDGWSVELSDTAGLRPSDDAIEAEGVVLARRTHHEADLTVLVLDRSEPLTESDLGLLAEGSWGLVVASKADLPPAWSIEAVGRPALSVSSLSGEGLERLSAELAIRLVPESPPPGVGVPFRNSHMRGLETSRRALQGEDWPGAMEALRGVARSR